MWVRDGAFANADKRKSLSSILITSKVDFKGNFRSSLREFYSFHWSLRFMKSKVS